MTYVSAAHLVDGQWLDDNNIRFLPRDNPDGYGPSLSAGLPVLDVDSADIAEGVDYRILRLPSDPNMPPVVYRLEGGEGRVV